MSTLTSTYSFVKPAQGQSPWDVNVNGDFDSIDSELARPRIPHNSPTVGATTTCDLSVARYFKFTVSQATTLAFTNVPANTFAVRIRLLITNGAAFLVTFPASVVWLGSGIPPKFKVSGVDEVEMVTVDAGTTWQASFRVSRPGVLFQAGGLTTSSTSDASVTSYTLPGGTLIASPQMLRITMGCQTVAQQGNINPKFGATAIFNTSFPSGQIILVTILLVRTGAATQIATAHGGSTTVGMFRSTPAETLANPILIDFRGSVVAGGTLNYDSIVVELLASP